MSLSKSLSYPKLCRNNSINLFWVLMLPHTELGKEVTIRHAPGSQRSWSFIGGKQKSGEFQYRRENVWTIKCFVSRKHWVAGGCWKNGLKSKNSLGNSEISLSQEAASELIPEDWPGASQKKEQRTLGKNNVYYHQLGNSMLYAWHHWWPLCKLHLFTLIYH